MYLGLAAALAAWYNNMVMQIAGARSAEQSGIIGGKTPFDPNII